MATAGIREARIDYSFFAIKTELTPTDLKISALVALTGFTYAKRHWEAKTLLNRVAALFFMIPVIGFVAQLGISFFNKPERTSLPAARARTEGSEEAVGSSPSKSRTKSRKELCYEVCTASRDGKLETIRELLSGDARLSQKNLLSAVFSASTKGHVEVIRLLLSEAGTLTENNLSVALSGACNENQVEVVKFLLSEDREISDRTVQKYHLMRAVADELPEILEFFLSKWSIDSDLKKALKEKASECGDPEAIRKIIDGEESDASTSKSQRELCYELCTASRDGKLETIRELLSRDARLSQKDLYSAVFSASTNGHVEVIRLLLSEAGTLTENNLSVALSGACNENQVEVVKFLLSEDREISDRTVQKYHLMRAVADELPEILEFFLSKWSIDSDLKEALKEKASECADPEVIKKIIDGEESDAAALKSRTLKQRVLCYELCTASRDGKLETIRELLSGDARLSRKNLLSAVFSASTKGHVEVIRLLLSEAGTLTENNLSVALSGACNENQVEVVKFLLSEDRKISDRTVQKYQLMRVVTDELPEILEFFLSKWSIDSDLKKALKEKASECGDPEAIQKILDDKARVEELDTSSPS